MSKILFTFFSSIFFLGTCGYSQTSESALKESCQILSYKETSLHTLHISSNCQVDGSLDSTIQFFFENASIPSVDIDSNDVRIKSGGSSDAVDLFDKELLDIITFGWRYEAKRIYFDEFIPLVKEELLEQAENKLLEAIIGRWPYVEGEVSELACELVFGQENRFPRKIKSKSGKVAWLCGESFPYDNIMICGNQNKDSCRPLSTRDHP